ncbi:MAG TPA: hypothetical protein VHC69_16425 [Polyangiaceae bacterium]|nr:hypothetical protein [Polyangiaceae bacterium]
MRSACFFLGLVASGTLAACTVEKCPPDLQCRPLNDNGTGGASGGASGKAGTGGSGGSNVDGGGGAQTGGTDSGPPPGEWVDVTANLSGMMTTCGAISGIWTKPDEDLLLVGVPNLGMFTSSDGANSWQAIGTAKGSANPNNVMQTVLFDPDHPDTYWNSGIHIGSGAYVTTDDGKTFTALSVDQSDSLGVDFTDKDRKTLLAGAHETTELYLSTDSGAHFEKIGAGKLPGNCTGAVVIDAQTFLLGCNGYTAGVTGVLRSTDQGKTWNKLTSGGGYGVPLRASDKSLYWTNSAGPGFVRSTDDGATWSDATSTGPTRVPVELPDGRIASLDTNGAIVLSSDQGATWKVVSPAVPPTPGNPFGGIAYSGAHKAFYYAHFVCPPDDFPVPDQTLLRYDFDYEAR